MKKLNLNITMFLLSTTGLLAQANPTLPEVFESISKDSLSTKRVMIENNSNHNKEVTISLPSYIDCNSRIDLEVIELGVSSYPVAWSFENHLTQEVLVIKRENFSAVESTCFEQYELTPIVTIQMKTGEIHLLLLGFNKDEYTLKTSYK